MSSSPSAYELSSMVQSPSAATSGLATEPSTLFSTPRASTSLTHLVDAYKAKQSESKGDETPQLPSSSQDHSLSHSRSHERKGTADTAISIDPEDYVVRLEGDNDPLDAHNLPFGLKAIACFAVAFNALIVR